MGGTVLAKIRKSDDQWRGQLSEQEFEVTRRAGTEVAFTGQYWDTKVPGTYHCRCCGEPLFSSDTKYDSGSGWPSFYQPIDPKSVEFREDRSMFDVRTEVVCSSCEAHLGHVFDDGPEPTGQRFCMNSASLKLARNSDDESG